MHKRVLPYLFLVAVMTGLVALSDLSLVIGAWQDNAISYQDQLARMGVTWAVQASLGAIATLVVLAVAGLVYCLPGHKRSFEQIALPLLATVATVTVIQAGQTWATMATPLPLDDYDYLYGLAPLAGLAVARCGLPGWLSALAYRLAVAVGIPAWAGLVILAGQTVMAKPEQSSNQASNVPQYVFILSIDSLSAKHMSLYGYSRETTPNLAEFAQQATVFDRMYASSNWTVSGIASLITGTRPWTHRGVNLSSGPDAAPFETGVFGLTKALGYTNSAYVTNLNASPKTHGGARWFDRIRYPLADTMSFGLEWPWQLVDRQPRMYGTEVVLYGYFDELLAHLGFGASTDNRSPAATFDAILADLAADSAKPGHFAYWAHFYPPHYPYAAPEPFLGKFDASPLGRTRFDSTPQVARQGSAIARDPLYPKVYANRYDEAIAYVDAEFGRFFSELKRLGIYDKSLIVVTADHGESFTHNCATHGGACLHEEVITIPLLIKQPGQQVMSHVWDAMEQVDLAPTLGELLGLVPEDRSIWEGTSMVPAMQGGSAAHPVFSMNFEDSLRYSKLPAGSVAVIDGPWKFIHRFGYYPGMYPVSLEDSLYNLHDDPDETYNAAQERPDVAGRLMSMVFNQLKAHASHPRAE